MQIKEVYVDPSNSPAGFRAYKTVCSMHRPWCTAAPQCDMNDTSRAVSVKFLQLLYPELVLDFAIVEC
ncbi:hypothetical protein, partial [Salmonella sp. s51228]|uniref:hypothetical protein n=1 Tax=Salmonella sp. s51228 TaxID=3159652 RepID=UPI00397F0A07